MLEFINEERTSRGLDPLTINNRLNDASEDHSQWMLDTDTFSHRGQDGSSSRDRIEDAGYELEGSWRTAENIGWQSERGAPGIADDVRDIHESLMASPGHRANLLNPELEDIGIGVEVGDFQGFEAVMITQNFGSSDAENEAPAPAGAPDMPVAEATPPVDPEPTVTPVEPAPPVVAEVPEEPAPPVVAETPEEPTPEPFDLAGFLEGFFGIRSRQEQVPPAPAEPESSPPPTEPARAFDDVFEFTAFADDRTFGGSDAFDLEIVSDFEGTITRNGETVTTDDRAEFDQMAADLIAAFSDLSCGADLQFV